MKILLLAFGALFMYGCEQDIFEERDSFLLTDSSTFAELKSL